MKGKIMIFVTDNHLDAAKNDLHHACVALGESYKEHKSWKTNLSYKLAYFAYRIAVHEYSSTEKTYRGTSFIKGTKTCQ